MIRTITGSARVKEISYGEVKKGAAVVAYVKVREEVLPADRPWVRFDPSAHEHRAAIVESVTRRRFSSAIGGGVSVVMTLRPPQTPTEERKIAKMLTQQEGAAEERNRKLSDSHLRGE